VSGSTTVECRDRLREQATAASSSLYAVASSGTANGVGVVVAAPGWASPAGHCAWHDGHPSTRLDVAVVTGVAILGLIGTSAASTVTYLLPW